VLKLRELDLDLALVTLGELGELVASAGIRSARGGTGTSRPARSAHFGAVPGKVEEIQANPAEQGASLAIFNHDLSPAPGAQSPKSARPRSSFARG